MSDGESGETASGPSFLSLRIAVGVPVAMVASWLLMGYAFNLVWFSPEILDPHTCSARAMEATGKGVCGHENGPVWWLGTFLVFVVGALCLIMTWVRTPRAGRWWPWPTATIVIMVGWFVLQQGRLL